MGRPRQFALVLLCGTVILAGWCAARLGGFEWLENTATPIWNRGATRDATTSSADAGRVGAALGRAMASVAAVAASHLKLPESAVAAVPAADAATVDQTARETGFVLAGASEAPAVEDALPDSRPTPPPETPMRLVSLFRGDPAKEDPQPAARPVETLDECLVVDICIDEYLWSLYERTPKVDTNKVTEKIKTTVKTKGKTRTVTKTITKYVIGDFTWKDPIAAQRAGMSLKDYVIGGMDRGFKLKLFRALRAIDDAGFMPGITSAFRDDYRQSIAAGNKAASDSSDHGGSRRGGYGHGLAVDLVSVKGETRIQRFASSEELWKWIDAHEKELGVGRPYLDRDPPHVTPIDGKEYAAKRGRPAVQKAGLKAQAAKLETRKPQAGAGNDPSMRAKQAKSSKVSSLGAPDKHATAK
ncbi:MAG TPA: peptidase M15 [Xanthobacteraceae bacterium]|nr:peptidase M15 [Xanthobacteraceae bacterium]